MPRRLPPALAAFLESGVSIQVGSVDAAAQPECIRGFGVRAEPAGDELTLFLPAATADATLANLRATGRIAICFSRPRDHRTVQVKGSVVAIGTADAGDRERIDRYRHALAEELAWVGLPERLTLRLTWWPSHAVRVRIGDLFDQTPGPGAGDPLEGSAP